MPRHNPIAYFHHCALSSFAEFPAAGCQVTGSITGHRTRWPGHQRHLLLLLHGQGRRQAISPELLLSFPPAPELLAFRGQCQAVVWAGGPCPGPAAAPRPSDLPTQERECYLLTGINSRKAWPSRDRILSLCSAPRHLRQFIHSVSACRLTSASPENFTISF